MWSISASVLSSSIVILWRIRHVRICFSIFVWYKRRQGHEMMSHLLCRHPKARPYRSLRSPNIWQSASSVLQMASYRMRLDMGVEHRRPNDSHFRPHALQVSRDVNNGACLDWTMTKSLKQWHRDWRLTHRFEHARTLTLNLQLPSKRLLGNLSCQ